MSHFNEERLAQLEAAMDTADSSVVWPADEVLLEGPGVSTRRILKSDPAHVAVWYGDELIGNWTRAEFMEVIRRQARPPTR